MEDIKETTAKQKSLGRVLVVDDEDHIRSIVCRMLQAEGYETAGAINGPDALAKVEAEEFHLMLLDLKMPGMNGLEVIRKVKVENPELTTILLTGVADNDEIKSAAANEGAYAVLTKPCGLQDIINCVDNAFNERRVSATIGRPDGFV
ncbi:MAG: response regulator [Chloroflexi bacterium]|nr:response regulator [Chloroflexota bacterium]